MIYSSKNTFMLWENSDIIINHLFFFFQATGRGGNLIFNAQLLKKNKNFEKIITLLFLGLSEKIWYV